MNIENDPRLTAYALGELVDGELQIFEQELANAGGAPAVLGEIHECAQRIRAAYATEPAYGMTAEQRQVLLADADAVEPVPLAVGAGADGSDRILPWVTQPVISEVDKRRIAAALRPSPWRRLVPVIGSLSVAAGVVWVASLVLMQEQVRDGAPDEVAASGDSPEVTISPPRDGADDGWARRRSVEARAGGGYPYRYGVPRPAGQQPAAVAGLSDPAIEGQRVSGFPVAGGRRSYETLRMFMLADILPPADEISVGQVLNAFNYGFSSPGDGIAFAVETEMADCPWDADRQLLQIGVTAADGEVAAADVQMAVEFNPETVAGYRLIGERAVSSNSEKTDPTPADVAGGQSVVALYEVVPKNGPAGAPADLMTVRVDYKKGGEGAGERVALSQEIAVQEPAKRPWREASNDLRFAASVAGYSMLLGGADGENHAIDDLVLELARDAIGDDPDGKRAEFVEWVEKTIEMKARGSSGKKAKGKDRGKKKAKSGDRN